MRTDRHARVSDCFSRARRLPLEDVAAFLDDECGDDRALRGEVESLLQQHHSEDTMDVVAVHEELRAIAPADASPASSALPDQIGRYRILRVIGAGGMGTVYEAEQDNPRRTVALKVINPGVSTPGMLSRFGHEAQVLGRLQDPGIAQVHEAGTFDAGAGAQPYFAMEFIRGEPLTSYADSRHLDTADRLALIAKICDAVQHAHQRGVIHRDLKPGNILVNEEGQPKILDFGVARATDADIRTTTLRTSIGQLVGTVPYMSPEQAAGDPNDLDTRSDVYALGVLTYELLAGRLPYELDRKLIHEAIRVIREDDPTPLSSINRLMSGDIETVVGKALEKNKDRRYQTASALGADIRRYLRDEPISARPPSTWYQLQKFSKRNRALVLGATAVLLVSVIGFAASAVFAVGQAQARAAAEDERNRAIEAERLAESRRLEAEDERANAEQQARIAIAVNDFLNQDLLAAVAPENLGREVTMREVLDVAAKNIEGRFPDDPVVEARIRQTIGDTYEYLGEYDAGEPHLRLANDLNVKHLGMGRPETMHCMSNLAILLDGQGKYEEAEVLHRRALEAQRQLLGDENPDTLLSSNNLAMNLYWQGKYDESAAMHEETLRIQRRTLGVENVETLISMNNMASMYHLLARNEEAAVLLEEAIEIQARLEHPEHPNVLGYRVNLAAVYRDLGRTEEAFAYHTETLDALRRVYGDDHPRTVAGITTMATFYFVDEQYEEALEYMAEGRDISARILGPEHPSTLGATNDMLLVMQKLGRNEEALPLVLETLATQRRVQGDEHPSTLDTMINLADIYMALERPNEALPMYVAAADGLERVYADEHWHSGAANSRLGACLTALKRYEDSEEALLEAHAILDATLGADHARTVKAVNRLIDLYTAWNREADAERWRENLPDTVSP